MRQLISTCVLLCTLGFGSACGDSGTGPSRTAFPGIWILASVNGVALPFAVQEVNPRIEITSERLDVASNGTFTQTGMVRITNGGQVSVQAYADAGNWTVTGSVATFRFNSDGSSDRGTVTDNTFSVTEADYSFVYAKAGIGGVDPIPKRERFSTRVSPSLS